MRRRAMAAVVLVVLSVLAGCNLGYRPSDSGAAPTDRPDVGELGRYDGYWYNQTLDVDISDGLNDRERAAVFSRAMARVQVLRGREFERDVEIELVTRQEFRERYDDVIDTDPPDDVRTLDNAQHEALFLVGSDRDVVEVRKGNRGDLVLGFYQPSSRNITLVGETDLRTIRSETTLAHELVHALQDQRFGLPSGDGGPLDRANARGGLVEGSAAIVASEYARNCESGTWQCVGVGTESARAAPGSGFNYGVYFVDFFPYAAGPTFVEYHRDRGGWKAVDEIYDDLPNASAEIIHPATYDTDTYGPATLTDRSNPEWDRVRTDAGGNATVGEAALAAMFAYTAYTDDGTAPSVIDASEFENVDDDGTLDDRLPFMYNVSYADGWYGDRLHAFGDGDETAVVWNVTFDDPANASVFRDGYERVVEFWGGTKRETRRGGTVWTLAGDRFDGAVWMRRDDNSVRIVKAPTVEDLGEVYAPADA